jgi:DNA gyrase subunit B
VRLIGVELAAQPEYRHLRAIARQIAGSNRPPFIMVRENARQPLSGWRDLLAQLKSEGMKDCSVQRYKGLGEMNAGQLWETTMNAETRTLLKIELKDLVESDEIFSTLMGENVENRRRFIEENALDVRNLDV